MKAWYFSTPDKKLRYGDNRVIRNGITHKIDITKLPPSICNHGLHAGKSVLDALQYAPGDYVWRVDLRGAMDIGTDKIAAESRTYLWGFDASTVLRNFARRCAIDVLHLWDAPDIVVRYLNTGDESLRDAALAAAWDAAKAAARDAAWAAAITKQRRRLAAMINAEAKKRGLV